MTEEIATPPLNGNPPGPTMPDRAAAVASGQESAKTLINITASKINNDELTVGYAIGIVWSAVEAIEVRRGPVYALGVLDTLFKDVNSRMKSVQRKAATRSRKRKGLRP